MLCAVKTYKNSPEGYVQDLERVLINPDYVIQILPIVNDSSTTPETLSEYSKIQMSNGVFHTLKGDIDSVAKQLHLEILAS